RTGMELGYAYWRNASLGTTRCDDGGIMRNRSIMVILAVCVSSCSRGSGELAHGNGQGAGSAIRPGVPDSLAAIRPLVVLLRTQLTTTDPVVTERVITCEVLRLDGIFGMARGKALVHEAIRLADAPADDSARRRVEAALVGQMWGMPNATLWLR